MAAGSDNDLLVLLNLSFEEAIFSAEKEVEIDTFVPCSRMQRERSRTRKQGDNLPCLPGFGTGRTAGRFPDQTTCARCQGTGMVLSSLCKECYGQGRTKQKKLYPSSCQRMAKPCSSILGRIVTTEYLDSGSISREPQHITLLQSTVPTRQCKKAASYGVVLTISNSYSRCHSIMDGFWSQNTMDMQG
jgi:hypothetical protein